VSNSMSMEQCCDECGRVIAKAHRVEGGRRYCVTCYARCFKRRLCSGCGMFSRLLQSANDPKCRNCVANAPCIRCQRAGRDLGMITEAGPVCNSCYPYFRESATCSLCNQVTQRPLHIEFDEGREMVCQRCATAHHRTCTLCRRHRLCNDRPDGTRICKKCDELGIVTCKACSSPMAAGRGSRCEDCYWKARGEAVSAQLCELLSNARVRKAFQEYVSWAMAEIDLPRLVRALPRHVVFFELLQQKAGDDSWSSARMLHVFGAAGLRKFELPVRWLQSSGVLEITSQEKEAAAEMGRSQSLVATSPKESLARRLLDEFYLHLHTQVSEGKIKPKSMRMSLRPAVSLLECADAGWQRMPDEVAVTKLLEATPGQRAALSTFLGFLKAKHGIVLSLPKVGRHRHPGPNKALGIQLAVLAKEQPRPSDFESRWLHTALAYFHERSLAQAKTLLKNGSLVEIDAGYELIVEGSKYWLPKPPSAAIDVSEFTPPVVPNPASGSC